MRGMNMRIFLETERLILAYLEYSDLENLVLLRSDPDVMRYINTGKIQTKEEVEQFLAKVIPYQDEYGFGFFSVFEKESGEFIGQAGLLHVAYEPKNEDIEVGYRFHKKYWGKGYATECVRALIRWGFEPLSISKLVAFAHPDNIRSSRVLEKVSMVYSKNTIYPGYKTISEGVTVKLYEIYKNEQVELVPYNPEWPKMAALEIEKLCQVLPQHYIIDIQHVGSTAIPGMIAKPVIDIQVTTTSLDDIKPIAIRALEEMGYQFWRNNPDPERLFFAKGYATFW